MKRRTFQQYLLLVFFGLTVWVSLGSEPKLTNVLAGSIVEKGQFMDEQHYGVKLSKDHFHRFTLWLDCNSEFYGSFENTLAQAEGRVVWPTLD